MSALILLVLLFISAPSLRGEPPSDVNAFMKRLAPLARRTKIEARFIQVRRFNAIDFEMKSTGNMSAEPGQSIVWETVTPAHTKCTMTGNSCSFWDVQSGKTITLPAKKHPWIAMLFRLSNSWVSADTQELQKNFTIRIQDEHTLHLTPRSREISEMFTAIQVTFNQEYSEVKQVVFTEKNKDTITIEFQRQ